MHVLGRLVLLQVPCANALGRKQLCTLWQQGVLQDLFVLPCGDVLCCLAFLVGVLSVVLAGASHHMSMGYTKLAYASIYVQALWVGWLEHTLFTPF